jgi:hypothetical protein
MGYGLWDMGYELWYMGYIVSLSAFGIIKK